MVVFEDKDIVEDPLDELDGIKAPNHAREGPVVELLNSLMRKQSGGSYHQQDPNRGHLSTADGCGHRNYLNYIHKLDDSKDVPDNDDNTNWTFRHGDAVHELIQELLLEELGPEHVSIEETVDYELDGDYYIYGHADIVIRDLESPERLNNALPSSIDIVPEDVKGFPDPFIIDIKTKSEFTYYNYGKGGHARTVPKENNIMQLNGYMGILGASYGCLLYYSKRNDHLEEYWVSFDQQMFEEAKDNITEVLDSVNTGSPPPRDADGAYMCEKFCKWHDKGICPGIEGADEPAEWDGDTSEIEYDNPEWEE